MIDNAEYNHVSSFGDSMYLQAVGIGPNMVLALTFDNQRLVQH